MDKDEWLETFGTNLLNIMNEKGISQRELADAAGVSEATISRYVNKRQIPNANVIVAIANALGCRPSDLIGV